MKLLSGSASPKARGASLKRHSHFFVRLGFVLLMVGLIAFALYQLVSHLTVGLDTLKTQEITEKSYVDLELFVFRDEAPVWTQGNLYEYHVLNGERVGVGDTVATTYTAAEGEDAVQLMLNAYTQQLCLLENHRADATPETLKAVKEALDDAYLSLLTASDNGRLYVAADAAQRMQTSLSHYRQLVDGSEDHVARPDALRAAISELLSGFPAADAIVTDRSGYFYTETDGYELSYDVGQVMTMTPDEFLSLTNEAPKTYEGHVAGKMVYSATWYAAAYVSLADVAETAFTVGDSYTMICTDSRKTEIDMTVVRLEPTADGALVVFKTNRMPEGFDFDRRFTVQTVTNRTSGYRIPSEALVTLQASDGREIVGVYILEGNVVEFRKVQIKVRREGYTVVATYGEVQAMLEALPDEEKNKLTADGWSYLELNDKIITRGTGLYEGKMIS